MDLAEPEEKKVFENILPLVNIVFLLLIFFMIAGTLIKPEALSVDVPTATSELPATVKSFTIVMSERQQFSIDKTLYTQAELLQWITQKVAIHPALIAQLKADSQIKATHIIALMNALGTTGLASIRLLTTHVAASPI
jgi:biopolymer transport protein ExbD